MSGTILENLSNRKLACVISVILIIQVVSFFIGAFIAPSPFSTERLLPLLCHRVDNKQLAIPRNSISNGVSTPKNCIIDDKNPSPIVFAYQIPLPRENTELDFSRWMSNLIAVLSPEIKYIKILDDGTENVKRHQINGTLTLKVDVAARDKDDKEWKHYFSKTGLKRTLDCHIDNPEDGHLFDCNLLQLFELQSLYYDYYVINVEILPQSDPIRGELKEFELTIIHQNGGFTKVWMTLKIIFTTITLLTLIWFVKRLNQMSRDTNLLEKTLVVVGVSMTQLNIPVELLSLYFDMRFMSFLSDVRQGILYCSLLSFWAIFVGEHLLDGVHRSQISSYFKQLCVILTLSIALLLFDSVERGIQWIDPFFTIWEVNHHLATIFVYIAAFCAAAYFLFLSHQIYSVLRLISRKKTNLPSMSSTRRLLYQGIIYRFEFLLLATFFTSAVTIIAYILGQVSEESYLSDEDADSFMSQIQWSSAMFTTVYAMWNCYIITTMILYAPSHKWLSKEPSDASEQIEFSRINHDFTTDDGTDNDEYGATASISGSVSRKERSDMQLLQDLTNKPNLD